MTTVAQTRTALDATLRYTVNALTDTRRDLALRWALEKVAKASGYLREEGSVAIVADDMLISHGLSRFMPGRLFASCHITTASSYRPVLNVGYNDITNLYRESVSTGQPEMIHFVGATKIKLYPKSDAAYTLIVPFERTASTWTLGDATGADVLDCPDAYLYGGLLDGAKYKLLQGIKDARTEAAQAKDDFQDFLDEIASADIDQGIDLGAMDRLSEQAWIS